MAIFETFKPPDCDMVRERYQRYLQNRPGAFESLALKRYTTSRELLEDARACGLAPHGRNRFFTGLLVALGFSALLWALLALALETLRADA
jgi:hypothetical protein